jgi:hypothetical protein
MCREQEIFLSFSSPLPCCLYFILLYKSKSLLKLSPCETPCCETPWNAFQSLWISRTCDFAWKLGSCGIPLIHPLTDKDAPWELWATVAWAVFPPCHLSCVHWSTCCWLCGGIHFMLCHSGNGWPLSLMEVNYSRLFKCNLTTVDYSLNNIKYLAHYDQYHKVMKLAPNSCWR